MTFTLKTFAALVLLAVFAVHAGGAAPPQTATRRFALLVGVDEYAQPAAASANISSLRGPANDVAEMKALLVDKYGFAPGNPEIVTLIGGQATVAAIETAFKSHLVENARKYPGSKIVFYFSGHGSQSRDLDGDEGDGIDETIVAHDSRMPGKNDIRDDDIEVWLQALAAHTRNVTVIFDSCNSGDATKDVRIQARGVPPNPNTDPNGVKPVFAKGVQKGGMFNNQPAYSFISGSLPHELSNEGLVLDEKGVTHYRGFLTHYLVMALRSDPTLTYERVVERIGPEISQRAPSQHPQAYGNALVPFLGLSENQEQAFIKIIGPPAGNMLTIRAGEILGIGPGTMFAVYSAKTKRLVGEAGKIANARAVKVSMDTSQIELFGTPVPEVTPDDKVVMVTPSTSRDRLPVLLSVLPQQSNSAGDSQMLARVRKLLKDDRLVQPASTEDWSIAIQRGCVTTAGELTPSGRLASAPASCRPAYYVAPVDNRDRALADVVASDAAVNTVAERLASFISLKARQDNLRKIVNFRSPLNDKVTVTLVRTVDRKGTAAVQEFGPTEVPTLSVGDKFQIKVANGSDEDLYVAILGLGTSGRTALFSISKNGELVQKKTTIMTKPALIAGRPYGLESYKVFLSTRPDVDYRVLESMGSRTTTGKSAFDMMLADYSNAGSRDAAPVPTLSLDEWTTKMVSAVIVK